MIGILSGLPIASGIGEFPVSNSNRIVKTAIVVALTVGCGSDGGPTRPSPSPPPVAAVAVLVGAGDIVECGGPGAAATATLLDNIEGTVFTAGDNTYFHGTEEEFRNCYGPTWGRHRARTRPAAGNHDYESSGAAPYYAYFGSSAGPNGLGYYSFSAGSWHIVSLNSNIPAGEGSPQLAWLRSDLAANPAACVGVIWHHPLYSSSENGPQPMMREAWQVLQQNNAEFVVSGHDHVYERFAPQDANGRLVGNGVRQFVAGTGGARHYVFGAVRPGSEVRGSPWGVLKFTLYSGRFDWEFVPIAGETFRDSGSDACH
jgi:acid phosphatase type 7